MYTLPSLAPTSKSQKYIHESPSLPSPQSPPPCLSQRPILPPPPNPSPNLPRPHRWPWNGIRSNLRIRIAINIDIDFRIAHAIHARDARQIARGRRFAASVRDGDLRALGIPLRGVGGMDRQQLVPEKVVAVGQGRGDGAGPARVLRDELAHAPFARRERAGD